MGKTISKPAPRLGEHTDIVLKSLLNMAESELKILREQGAIK
jgi:crotonobetainyl-CoA:carnitine CoA-transferase CaiB-like acyl-CoA transferase